MRRIGEGYITAAPDTLARDRRPGGCPVRSAYLLALGALVGAGLALHACARLERSLDAFFGAGDRRLYVMEDAT